MKFYKCDICGKVVCSNKNNESCCNNQMLELIPNVVDAAQEKHIPYCQVENGKINVTVGETIHPMSDEHYIEFIAVVGLNGCKRVDLKPGLEPKAVFDYEDGAKVFAYCNIHGLWEFDL